MDTIKEEMDIIKEDLLVIEREVFEDLGYLRQPSGLHKVETMYGEYVFTYTDTGVCGRFCEIGKYKHLIPNRYVECKGNIYERQNLPHTATGVWNFIGDDIYDFQRELYQIVLTKKS